MSDTYAAVGDKCPACNYGTMRVAGTAGQGLGKIVQCYYCHFRCFEPGYAERRAADLQAIREGKPCLPDQP